MGLANYSVACEETQLNRVPIFVILCVLCFQRQSFFTFIKRAKLVYSVPVSLKSGTWPSRSWTLKVAFIMGNDQYKRAIQPGDKHYYNFTM